MTQTARGRGRPQTNEIDAAKAIMTSAVAIFADKGFDAANLREIAEAAGVNMALVSYNFGSKLGLWKRIIEAVGHRIEERQASLAQATGFGDLGAALRASMSAFIGFMDARPEVARFMMRDMDHDPERAQWLYQNVTRRLLDHFLPLIERARTDGYTHVPHPELALQQFAFGTAVGILRRDRLAQSSPEFLDDDSFRAALQETLVEPLFRRG